MKIFISSAIAYIFSLVSAFWCFISYVKAPDQVWYPIFALIFGFAVTYVMTDLAMRVINRPIPIEEDEEDAESA